MSDTKAPRWRVTFRRAGEPKTTDTLVIAGMDSMVSALKEAQMMLAEKEGGPWVIQAIEEIEPVVTISADRAVFGAPVIREEGQPHHGPFAIEGKDGRLYDDKGALPDTAKLGDALDRAKSA